MLRKMHRAIWCFAIKHFKFCHEIQKTRVKRKTDVLKFFRAKRLQAAQRQAILMSIPTYREHQDIVNFLRRNPNMWRFVELAAAHYNIQIDKGPHPRKDLYIKPDFDSKLDIAEDYFRRNRAGLVEWWCKFTEDGKAFLGDECNVKLDLGIPFYEVFTNKFKKILGFEPNLDKVADRKFLSWPCLDVNGNPNVDLMEEVKFQANIYSFNAENDNHLQ